MTNQQTTRNFYGAKGGVGTTTTCARAALAAAGDTALVVLRDLTGTGDLASVLGVNAPDEGQTVTVVPGVVLADAGAEIPSDATAVYSDCGRAIPTPGTGVLVVRNDYLSLRAAVRATAPPAPQPVAVACVLADGMALQLRDVERSLGLDIVTVLPVDPAISRAVDAGLLTSRIERGARALAAI